MDSTQLLLLIVILILTVFLIVIGIQVFFILRELKVTLTKLNKVLSDAGEISEKVKHPATIIEAIGKGLKLSLNLINSVKKRTKDKEE